METRAIRIKIPHHELKWEILDEYADTRDPLSDPEPMLVVVRSIAHSPFAGEEGYVLYLGGFDCSFIAARNTGWIYCAKH